MNRLMPVSVLLSLILYAGCALKAPRKEPDPQKTIDEFPMKLDLPKDGRMYQAFQVLEHYGRKTQSHMSYARYKKSTSSGGLSSWSPDWFYDSYQVPLNEKGHWITVTYHTASAAVRRDQRIEKLMENVPHHSIDVKLRTPKGESYILTDTEADGVLDFVAPETEKKSGKAVKVDFPLLQKMQVKYTWILSIIKKSYNSTKK